MFLSSCLTPSPALLQLSNRLFEELAMDVYDEVDRRENDAGERGGAGCSPPGPGPGRASRSGEEQPAEPCAPPDLDASAGTAGPSFFIPPAGKVCSARGAAAGCQGWGAAGGGCRDPQGWGLSLLPCPRSGGWQGGGCPVSVVEQGPTDVSNHLQTSWGVLSWSLKG